MCTTDTQLYLERERVNSAVHSGVKAGTQITPLESEIEAGQNEQGKAKKKKRKRPVKQSGRGSSRVVEDSSLESQLLRLEP